MRIEEIDSNFKLAVVNEPDVEWITARDGRFSLCGVYYDDEEGCYARLPQGVARRISAGVFHLHAKTSGGRLRFKSNSPYVAVKAVIRRNCIMRNMCVIGTAGFAVYADGVFVNSIIPDVAELSLPTPPSAGIQGIVKPGEGERDYEIYFPLYNEVYDLYIGVKQGSRVEPLPFSDTRRVVFYGSSITQGGCATRPGNDYAAIVCRRLGVDYVNLGFSGQGKGEPLMAEYLADMHADVYVIDYDHNAPTPEHLEATHYPLYRAIREKNPDAAIVCMSLPDFNYSERHKLRRSIIRSTCERGRADGDEKVYFIDGETLFEGVERDACTMDGCHPNDLGFFRMANVVEPVLREVLGK